MEIAQIIAAFVFGVVFIVALILLAVRFPAPTPFQYNTFRVALSLAAAGVAAMVPGFINLTLKPEIGLVIRAGGALAVFAIVYYFNPAKLPQDTLPTQPFDRPKLHSYHEFMQMERQAQQEVWIISPGSIDALLDTEPFFDVVACNLARKIRYRYFVPKKGDYEDQFQLLLSRLTSDSRIGPIARTLVSLDRLSSLDWPCPFVVIDPRSANRQVFVIVSKDAHTSHYWVEIDASSVSRFVAARASTMVSEEATSG